MLQDQLDRLKRLPKIGAMALGFGLVYCLLLCVFCDAIEAADDLRDFLRTPLRRGPETLFLLNSGVLGWVSYAVMADWLRTVGVVVWLASLLLCFLAVAVGVGLTHLFAERVPGSIWMIGLFSAVTAALTSALRGYLHKSA